MKLQILAITMAFFTLPTFIVAQVLEREWAYQFGSVDDDLPNDVAFSPAGDIFVTGNFTGSADFDPGPNEVLLTSAGLPDIFIQKFNPEGELQWAKNFGGDDVDQGRAVVISDTDEIYLTGSFSGTVNFDLTTTDYIFKSESDHDGFILKMDAEGNTLWAQHILGTDDFNPNAARINSEGDIIIGGTYEGATDFDPGPGEFFIQATGFFGNGFVLSITPAGAFQWVKTFTATSEATIGDLKIDSEDNIVFFGALRGSGDWDPGPDSLIITQVPGASTIGIVVKLNSDGDLIWAAPMHGTGANFPLAIELDDEDNIYSGAGFFGIGDFDPGIGEVIFGINFSSHMYVQKLNADGELVWVKFLSVPSSSEFIRDIVYDKRDNIYVVGSFTNTTDFHPSPNEVLEISSQGMEDGFCLQIDINGEFKDVTTFGSSGTDRLTEMIADEAGNLYMAGHFSNTIDFDPGLDTFTLSSFSGLDIFLLKFNNLSVATQDIHKQLDITLFPNPVSQNFVLEKKNEDAIQVYIYDQLGKIVLMENYREKQSEIDFSAFPSGVYFIEVISSEGRAKDKIIKH